MKQSNPIVSSPDCCSDGSIVAENVKKRLSRILVSILLPILIAGLVIVIFEVAHSQSSLKQELPHLLLSVNPTPAYVCKAHQGDIVMAEFTVLNTSSETVKLLGASSTCGCTTVEDNFPIELAPNAAQKIHVRVTTGPPESNGKFQKAVRLFVNNRGAVPLLIVAVEVSKS